MESLPREFYRRPTVTVARDLLGRLFLRRIGNTLLGGIIVETEAYGPNDPASHAFRGRTQRNSVMFLDGGHLYVYFTYGMHFCANVVTRTEGIGEAVLIRAIEPIEGMESMANHRGVELANAGGALYRLTNGPAKICEAFRIGRKENGIDLVAGDSITIREGSPPVNRGVVRSTRIGIRQGTEKLWRFSIRGNDWVSRQP